MQWTLNKIFQELSKQVFDDRNLTQSGKQFRSLDIRGKKAIAWKAADPRREEGGHSVRPEKGNLGSIPDRLTVEVNHLSQCL